MNDNIKVSCLKGLAVYVEDDLYDLACLYLRVEHARGTQKTVTGNTVSLCYLTIHGLCSKFDNLVGADQTARKPCVRRPESPPGRVLSRPPSWRMC